MPSTIEEYLAELRSQLAGEDPALVQDALYDAEEFLRSETAAAGSEPEAAFATAVERYGTPDEVAAAYRDAEITVSKALRAPAQHKQRSWIGRFFGVVADPAAYGALFYMLLALATGTIYFSVVVTGLSMSLGLAVLIIGIPFFLLFVAVVRAISLAEGRLIEALLGERMPRRPRLAPASTGEGMVARVKAWFTDYRTWTTMLYMVLQLPLGIIYFTLMVTGLATSVALVISPVLQRAYHIPMFIDGTYGYYTHPAAYPLVMALGVLGFFLTLWLAKGIGIVHGMWAKAMLVGRFDGPATTQTQSAQVPQ